MSQWYFSENETKQGPVYLTELQNLAQSGRITPETLVWQQGLPTWVAAATVQGLFPGHVATVPPLPAQPAARSHATREVPEETGDATGGVIPYKNTDALIAYYAGVFSLIACVLPFVGLVLPALALFLGLRGRRKYIEKPVVRGLVHAWIGIIAGIVFGLCGIAVSGLLVIAMLNHR